MNLKKISVVVCAKNEESRIEDCLKSIILNKPDEVIVVDGSSTDKTVEIARRYTKNIIVSEGNGLSHDRKLGIERAKNELVAMIDADHRLDKDDIKSLVTDMDEYKLDIVQSQLRSFENHGFWNIAEEQAWELTHNTPGPRKMIGVAPAIFKKEIFELVQFDDSITKTIDDTDFVYRLSKFSEVVLGIGNIKIKQIHFSGFNAYFKKFKWYGKGDGEFCRKHPERALSMVFHLLVRYPLMYTLLAIRNRQYKASLFFIVQGLTRFYGMMLYFVMG